MFTPWGCSQQKLGSQKFSKAINLVSSKNKLPAKTKGMRENADWDLRDINNQLQFVDIIWILITFSQLTSMKKLGIGTLAIRYVDGIKKALLILLKQLKYFLKLWYILGRHTEIFMDEITSGIYFKNNMEWGVGGIDKTRLAMRW